MKKFFSDFKKFISRGNVMDLAVGVVVGSAFTAIVTALTNKIIKPLVNWIIALIGGKEGLASVCTILSPAYKTDANGAKVLDLESSIYIDWGAFIVAILDFFIIAFVVFTIMRVLMRSRELMKDAADRAKDGYLSRAERKELKAAGIKIKDREAVKAYFEAKKAEEEKLKAEEEAKKAAEAEEAKKNSTEYLLKEIRDLLIENKELKAKTSRKKKEVEEAAE
ncbi:MAG: large conductance mechanosensitive channel protein MscL [Clostridia bacterium]|nr:large conductance mechanosensitive channel protein MscL [Clostridia bacterium]